MSVEPLRYRAFISYSHRDERWARWLHRALERYRIPRRLVGRETASGTVPARLAPVFRDREELPTGTDLGRVVNAALEQSAALIVICSPAAAQSRWVNEEVRAFHRLGRQERIFCLIVAGAPEGDDAEQCFPPALRRASGPEGSPSDVDREPIGADLRPGKDGQHAALLKLIAGMLGVGLDELARRDLQRRNRRLLALTAAAVAGMGITTSLAVLALMARNEAEAQRTRAEIEARTAEQTSEFLVELFQVVDPSEARGNTVTAREILDRGAARIDDDLADQPEVRANLMRTMGRVYTGLGLYEPATELLAGALAERAELQRQPTAERLATANELGWALYLKGEYEAAEAVYGDAVVAGRALFPDGDPLLTAAICGVGELLEQGGDYEAAEQQFRDALEIDRRLHVTPHADVARTLAGLAGALMNQERFAESEAAFRESLAIRRQALGDDHPLVAETLNELGSVLYFAGDSAQAGRFFSDAAELYERILGKEHPFVSSLLNNLGRLALESGALDDADRRLSEALALDRKLKDANHDDFVFTLNNLGLVRLGQGQNEAAERLFTEALEVAELHDHRMLGQVWANLAEVHLRAGRQRATEQAIAAARPLLQAQYADDPWHEANLASIEALVSAGDAPEATESTLLDSHAVIMDRWGEESLFTRLSAARLATFYARTGREHLAGPYRRAAEGR